jgi:hypothetical protein
LLVRSFQNGGVAVEVSFSAGAEAAVELRPATHLEREFTNRRQAMAVIYSLSGGGIQVDYTVGDSFVFKQGGTTKTFTGAEIKIDQTGLGTLVEVPLVLTIDTGGSRFGVFVPAAPTTAGQSAAVSTVGVTETFSGPNSIPRRPSTWMRPLRLTAPKSGRTKELARARRLCYCL